MRATVRGPTKAIGVEHLTHGESQTRPLALSVKNVDVLSARLVRVRLIVPQFDAQLPGPGVVPSCLLDPAFFPPHRTFTEAEVWCGGKKCGTPQPEVPSPPTPLPRGVPRARGGLLSSQRSDVRRRPFSCVIGDIPYVPVWRRGCRVLPGACFLCMRVCQRLA